MEMTLMYLDNPMIDLRFENNKLVEAKDLGYRSGLMEIDHFMWVDKKNLEKKLFRRVISRGRRNRNKIYFNGKSLHPLEELLITRGADVDDDCWLKFKGEEITYKEVFKDAL